MTINFPVNQIVGAPGGFQGRVLAFENGSTSEYSGGLYLVRLLDEASGEVRTFDGAKLQRVIFPR